MNIVITIERRHVVSRLGSLGAAAVLIAGLTVAGCSSSSSGSPGSLSVVASTNVWGSVVEQLAGRLSGGKVQVTSIITDPAADPHEYEANPRNELAIKRADLVIENGGGYDNFIDSLRKAAGGDAEVINAVQVSGKPVGPSFNEHIWYDFPTVEKVAQRIEAFLIAHDKADTSTFRANASAFVKQLHNLEADEALMNEHFGGDGVAITEPVPLYTLTACGFVNRTPEQFSHAVEEGTDVAPRVLNQTLALFTHHQVKLLVYNKQTGGQTTDSVRGAADDNNIPSVGVTETLPEGKTYLSWMRGNLKALAAAAGTSLNLT
jgi:zinc/manganese transport system substrate-binding protein